MLSYWSYSTGIRVLFPVKLKKKKYRHVRTKICFACIIAIFPRLTSTFIPFRKFLRNHITLCNVERHLVIRAVIFNMYSEQVDKKQMLYALFRQSAITVQTVAGVGNS